MIYKFAKCELNVAKQRLLCDGVEVAIEPQVFDLLHLLAANPSRLVTRDEIIEAVWGGRVVSESAISARIAAARKAVGDDGKRQDVIRTHHGRGLELVAKVEVADTKRIEEPESTDVPKVRYTSSPLGHSLAYMVSGSGPPLIQMDGPPLSREKAWHIPPLRDGYSAFRKGRTLVQMDWAGTGLSEAFDVTLGVEQNAEDVIRVADTVGLEQFDLLSESGACLEAVTLAANHPDRVRRLVMVGAYAEGRELRESDGRPEVLKTMMEAGWEKHEGGIATAFMTAYFPEGPAEAVPQMVGLMQDSASRAFTLSMRDRSNRASTVHLLDKVRCPTLIVQGRDDAVHPLSQAQKLAAGIPNAELLVLESANHLPIPGHRTWDEFIINLRAFLDG